jgi:hypothetical protein
MLRPATEIRVYDCYEPLPRTKRLCGGPRFLVARGAAHLLKLRNTAALAPRGAAAAKARCDAVMR